MRRYCFWICTSCIFMANLYLVTSCIFEPLKHCKRGLRTADNTLCTTCSNSDAIDLQPCYDKKWARTIRRMTCIYWPLELSIVTVVEKKCCCLVKQQLHIFWSWDNIKYHKYILVFLGHVLDLMSVALPVFNCICGHVLFWWWVYWHPNAPLSGLFLWNRKNQPSS